MSTYVSPSQKAVIRVTCRNCCAYCRTPENLTTTTFEIEHIIPLAAGGRTEIGNLCLACPTCNRFKANLQAALDLVSGEVVPLFHPNLQRWDEHFAWNNNRSEIIGLTATGRATVELLRMNRPELVRMRKLWIKLDEFPVWIE